MNSDDTTGWRTFRRRGEVDAVQLEEGWTWTTDDGGEMSAQPGDWRVTDDAGSVRSVAAHVFAKSYARIGPGRYRRVGVFRAREVVGDEVIETLEGPAAAHPGDWVVEGSAGEQWPVPGEKFAQSYEEIDAVG
ncbi:MAG: hypothetical protein QM662_13015 [Gordonia sp. (in: high G+C Gram-positive bacteria)]